jgi:hypothetical protein
MEMIASTLGYAALGITLVSFSLANDKMLQKLNLLGCMLWAVHFGMMKEYSACLMLVVACIMVASSIAGYKQMTNFAWLFNILLIPVMATMIIGGGTHWVAILPVIGGFFINTGVAKCSGYGMTITIMMGHVIWIIAAALMGSAPALIANFLNFAALAFREISRRKNVAKLQEDV